jgi:hypothetical protein
VGTALAGAALILASCSSTASSASDTTNPATSEQTLAAVDTTMPLENYDSFRGVTADTVKIGIGYIDATDFGFDRGDVVGKYQTIIDHINDNGGVSGREIEASFIPYSPVDSVASAAACTAFTEDDPVFAFLGETRQDDILCYTEGHETISINRFQVTQEQIDRSNGLAFSIAPMALRLVLTGIDALDDADLVADKKFIVHADLIGEVDIEPVEIYLDALGAEVVLITQSVEDGSDVDAARAEMNVHAEKWNVAGADAVIALGDASVGVVGAVDRNDLDLMSVVTNNNTSLYTNFGNDPANANVVAIAPKTVEAKYADASEGVQECADRFSDATGEVMNLTEDPDLPNNLESVVSACQMFEIFDAIGDVAGAELTNETFQAAANTLVDFEVTGMAKASISQDKRDVPEEAPILYVFDAESQLFVPREG